MLLIEKPIRWFFIIIRHARPEDGSFVRDGYTLVGYNTKADGTGEAVSLGGRIQAFGAASLDLYCMWEENTPETDFTYETSSGTAAITGYTPVRLKPWSSRRALAATL